MLNEENRIDTITIILASMLTVAGLIISFANPNLQILVLTILTILLPVIYQIGNICSKESVKNKVNKNLGILEEAIEKLEHKHQ